MASAVCTGMCASVQSARGISNRPTLAVSGEGDQLALAGALGISTLGQAASFLKKWTTAVCRAGNGSS